MDTTTVFDMIKEGPDAYVRQLPFEDKTIAEAEALLPSGYRLAFESDKSHYPDTHEQEHPDRKQYAIYRNDDPNTVITHLYWNGGIITETLIPGS